MTLSTKSTQSQPSGAKSFNPTHPPQIHPLKIKNTMSEPTKFLAVSPSVFRQINKLRQSLTQNISPSQRYSLIKQLQILPYRKKCAQIRLCKKLTSTSPNRSLSSPYSLLRHEPDFEPIDGMVSYVIPVVRAVVAHFATPVNIARLQSSMRSVARFGQELSPFVTQFRQSTRCRRRKRTGGELPSDDDDLSDNYDDDDNDIDIYPVYDDSSSSYATSHSSCASPTITSTEPEFTFDLQSHEIISNQHAISNHNYSISSTLAFQFQQKHGLGGSLSSSSSPIQSSCSSPIEPTSQTNVILPESVTSPQYKWQILPDFIFAPFGYNSPSVPPQASQSSASSQASQSSSTIDNHAYLQEDTLLNTTQLPQTTSPNPTATPTPTLPPTLTIAPTIQDNHDSLDCCCSSCYKQIQQFRQLSLELLAHHQVEAELPVEQPESIELSSDDHTCAQKTTEDTQQATDKRHVMFHDLLTLQAYLIEIRDDLGAMISIARPNEHSVDGKDLKCVPEIAEISPMSLSDLTLETLPSPSHQSSITTDLQPDHFDLQRKFDLYQQLVSENEHALSDILLSPL